MHGIYTLGTPGAADPRICTYYIYANAMQAGKEAGRQAGRQGSLLLLLLLLQVEYYGVVGVNGMGGWVDGWMTAFRLANIE